MSTTTNTKNHANLTTDHKLIWLSVEEGGGKQMLIKADKGGREITQSMTIAEKGRGGGYNPILERASTVLLLLILLRHAQGTPPDF